MYFLIKKNATRFSVLGGDNPLDRPVLPPIKSLEAGGESELEDLSIILLSPKKLPKLEHFDDKSSELHEELPTAERGKELLPLPVPPTNTESTSLEDLAYSVTAILAN